MGWKVSGDFSISTDEGRPVATVECSVGRDQSMRDARLIAAAPKMLEALRRIYATVGRESAWHTRKRCSRVFAKATGRSIGDREPADA